MWATKDSNLAATALSARPLHPLGRRPFLLTSGSHITLFRSPRWLLRAGCYYPGHALKPPVSTDRLDGPPVTNVPVA